MSVYKPKKSPFYHYDFWISGLRFSGSTERTSKAEAKKVEASKRDQAKRDVEHARAGGTGPMTIAAGAKRYWDEVGKHHRRAATTLTDLNRLVDYFGPAKPLFEISDDDVARMVSWRRAQQVHGRKTGRLLSPATVNRSTIEPLQKICNRASSLWKVLLPNMPKWDEHLLDEPQERVREVRASEEGALDAIRPDYRPVIDFARASGLRMAECLLRKDQVDLVGGVVRTVGKGDKPIIQPITSEMRAILMSEMANPTEFVFTYRAARAKKTADRARGDREPITISGLKTTWRRSKAGGLPKDLRFHDLRHDFATKLLRETGNLKLVQKALHHSKVETTVRYAHISDVEVLAGMEASSRAQGRARGRETASPDPEQNPGLPSGKAVG